MTKIMLNKSILLLFLYNIFLIYSIVVLILIAVLLSTNPVQVNLGQCDGAIGTCDSKISESRNDHLNSAQPIDMNQKRTLILIKPNGVQRKLVGKIIERFENKGLKLVGMKLVLASKEILDEHYSQHKNKPFHDILIEFMTSGPLVIMIWEGPNVIQITRNLLGYYDPVHSEPGTIRGDFSMDITENIIHGSDSVETANMEIKLWFNENEIIP